jgi:SecY interacting protein Syd
VAAKLLGRRIAVGDKITGPSPGIKSMQAKSGSLVTAALDCFVASYQARYPRLEDVFDEEWRSACTLGEPFFDTRGERRVAWRPVRRPDDTDDFQGLENALERAIHPDIKAYYGRYWSGGLEATAPDGHVSLLFLWNEDDARRLVENLIGHALAKRRARTPFTVFFACTEPGSDLFLSVDNDSGNVMLEVPGAKPKRKVAESLAAFLDTLDPAPPELHPER